MTWDNFIEDALKNNQCRLTAFFCGESGTKSAAAFERFAFLFALKSQLGEVFHLGSKNECFDLKLREKGIRVFDADRWNSMELLTLTSTQFGNAQKFLLIARIDEKTGPTSFFKIFGVGQRYPNARFILQVSCNVPYSNDRFLSEMNSFVICHDVLNCVSYGWRHIYQQVFGDRRIDVDKSAASVVKVNNYYNPLFDGDEYETLNLDDLFPGCWRDTPKVFCDSLPAISGQLFDLELDRLPTGDFYCLPDNCLLVFRFALTGGDCFQEEKMQTWKNLRSVCKLWRILADEAMLWTRTRFCPLDHPATKASILEGRFRAGLVSELSRRRLQLDKHVMQIVNGEFQTWMS